MSKSMRATETTRQQSMEDMAKALHRFTTSNEVHSILAELGQLQRQSERLDVDTWDTVTGRRVEAALGYLQMALDAAKPGHRIP